MWNIVVLAIFLAATCSDYTSAKTAEQCVKERDEAMGPLFNPSAVNRIERLCNVQNSYAECYFASFDSRPSDDVIAQTEGKVKQDIGDVNIYDKCSFDFQATVRKIFESSGGDTTESSMISTDSSDSWKSQLKEFGPCYSDLNTTFNKSSKDQMCDIMTSIAECVFGKLKDRGTKPSEEVLEQMEKDLRDFQDTAATQETKSNCTIDLRAVSDRVFKDGSGNGGMGGFYGHSTLPVVTSLALFLAVLLLTNVF